MKARLALLSAFLALPVLAACRTPASPPNPDASDASSDDLSARACANMNAQGCPQASDCPVVFRTALATNAVSVPFVTCLSHVLGDPRRCGPQVRCGETGAAPLSSSPPMPALTPESIKNFAAWNERDASDPAIDERMKRHDQAARDMERLMNSGF